MGQRKEQSKITEDMKRRIDLETDTNDIYLVEDLEISEKIEYYFLKKGLKVLDMQMVVHSEGIADGWVIFEDGEKILETHWDDAVYNESIGASKKWLLECSYEIGEVFKRPNNND